MGKAKRQINAARKKIFAEISRQYSQEPDYLGHDAYIKVAVDPATTLVNLVHDIRQSLFEYVDKTAYPLCEYLDMDNMINYVEWVLKPHL